MWQADGDDVNGRGRFPTRGPQRYRVRLAGNRTGTGEAVEQQPLVLSVEEARLRYHGEWVLMQVREYDEHANPSGGPILAHSPHRDVVSQALRARPPSALRREDPDAGPYYIFKAIPVVCLIPAPSHSER